MENMRKHYFHSYDVLRLLNNSNCKETDSERLQWNSNGQVLCRTLKKEFIEAILDNVWSQLHQHFRATFSIQYSTKWGSYFYNNFKSFSKILQWTLKCSFTSDLVQYMKNATLKWFKLTNCFHSIFLSGCSLKPSLL